MTLEWHNAVDLIYPHVFKIMTSQGNGTGFLIYRGGSSTFVGIATAAHVINKAHDWEEPIRIQHFISKKTIMLRHKQRCIILDPTRDTAAILFDLEDLLLPATVFPLINKETRMSVGIDVGWIGFPSIFNSELCFFNGKISAWIEENALYLVDGVAINGVSGGPAFCIESNKLEIIGIVSAYKPNRLNGDTLPGLAIIRDVAQLHKIAPTFKSISEEKSK